MFEKYNLLPINPQGDTDYLERMAVANCRQILDNGGTWVEAEVFLHTLAYVTGDEIPAIIDGLRSLYETVPKSASPPIIEPDGTENYTNCRTIGPYDAVVEVGPGVYFERQIDPDTLLVKRFRRYEK